MPRLAKGVYMIYSAIAEKSSSGDVFHHVWSDSSFIFESSNTESFSGFFKIPMKNIKQVLNEEKKFQITNKEKYLKFQKNLDKIKNNVSKNIIWLKKRYKKIYGYAASAKTTVTMNFFGIDDSLIKNVIDDNSLKQGNYIPGTGVKIIAKKSISKEKCVIVFAWNMFEEIKNNNNIFKYCINIRDLYKSNFIKKFKKNLK